MSACPPPIPQKNKPKPCSGPPLLSQLIGSTHGTYPVLHTSKNDVCDALNPIYLYQSLIHHFNNQCNILKEQDQQILQLFMCIREEILLLQEIGNLYEYSPGKPYPNDQSLYNLSDKRSSIKSQNSVESVILSHQVYKEEKKLESLHFDVISHFDTLNISIFLDEFKQSLILSHGCRNIPTIYSTKEISIIENVSNLHTLPPPIPQKRAKRNLFPECNLPLNSLNLSDDHSHPLICDPVLDQGWPKSKAFNSNAFLNHTRKSSMTLSDFYDHLNPLSICENSNNVHTNNCEQSTCSSRYRLPSLMLSTSSNHKQILPTSKSNFDCKLSSLDLSPHSGLENSKDTNTPASTESKDSRLFRAGSSPSLCSLSVLPKLQVIDNLQDLAKTSEYNQNIEELYTSENFKFQPIVPKSPKKLLSFISRGISNGFNKHSSKKQSQKYSQSSNDLSETVNLNTDIKQNANTATKAKKKIQEGVSLLKPLAEIPPPIPPKYNKQNSEKDIDLQQTWC